MATRTTYTPVSAAPRRPARRSGALGARLRAWWCGAAFDDALAAGLDPASDPRLSAHAARLARPHCVEALADGLERAVADADRPRRAISAAAPISAGEVLAARDDLLALVAVLRTAPEPSPQALALTRRLLIDSTGPLFQPADAGALARAAREALGAFDTGRPAQSPRPETRTRPRRAARSPEYATDASAPRLTLA